MKKAKNSIQRKCIVSKEVKDVKDLIRIVKTKDGQFFVNSNKKGRGAYVSYDADYELLKRKRLLNKSFKQNISNDIYLEIEKIMKGE